MSKKNIENTSEEDFLESDKEFIRVLEDLIDILLKNGTVRLTDFPTHAIEKISKRKQLRSSLDLLSDDDLII